MRNLFALVGAAVVGFLAAGYFLGWYHVDVTTGNISFNVNASKVEHDIESGEHKGQKFIADNKNKLQTPAPTTPNSPQQPNGTVVIHPTAPGGSSPPPPKDSFSIPY